MRYLGLNAVCYALDDAWGSGDHAPQEKRATYTMIHKVVGFSVQILSWLVLLAGYVLVVLGVNRLRNVAYPEIGELVFFIFVRSCASFSWHS